MPIQLRDYQLTAVDNMKNGCILCGGVGSGKSLTALAYYYTLEGGDLEDGIYYMGGAKTMKEAKKYIPKDLYIITTARKRDELEWDKELIPFLLSRNPEINIYKNNVVIDSWNNIKKYRSVINAFFIFDEQRVVGNGTWVDSFLKITKKNEWILLSATPGDTWTDYIPVFIANGFYKNRTEFVNQHVIYSRFSKYPKIDRYFNTGRLVRLRANVLVNMDFHRPTVSHHTDIWVDYDMVLYRKVQRDRWNPWEKKPIKNAAELCYSLRKVVNADASRLGEILKIIKEHPKAIIFYNFDYELLALRTLVEELEDVEIAEWNGHKHQEVPDSDKWIYLVQYNAGAEGWNCIKTDTIIFYSQNYSYKIMEQSSGRIDRMNTPFHDLYYYHIKSKSAIDLAISRAVANKKKFNETKWVSTHSPSLCAIKRAA